MRIDAYNAISQVYQTNTNYKPKATGSSYGSDKVEISTFGKEFQAAKAAVAQAPDVREDKIAEIKAMMSAGTYNISGMDFANKIVDEYSSELAL